MRNLVFCIAKFTPVNSIKDGQNTNYDKMLFIRTDAIGDNILASIMLKGIKVKYPDVDITVLCDEQVMSLYEYSPHVKNIIGINKKRFNEELEYKQKIISNLNTYKFDVAINSVYSSEAITDIIMLASGAKQTFRIDGNYENNTRQMVNEARELSTFVIKSSEGWQSEIERNKDFLIGLGIEERNLTPEIWLSKEDEKFAVQFFKENGLNPKKTIVLFAGARHDVRLYYNYGNALSKLCKENNFSVISVGSQNDYKINQDNLDNIQAPSINLCGKTTLRQTAAIIKKCRLAVGSETGNSHIACAVGTPNVIILGGGHFGRFIPYSNLTSIVSLPLSCYGCNWNCKFERAYCVKDIDPELILEAIQNSLKNKSDKPRVYYNELPNRVSFDNLVRMLSYYLPIDQVELIEVKKTGRMTYSEKIISLVEESIQSNHLANARELLDNILVNDPSNLDALNNLAVIEILKNNFHSGIEYLKKVISLNPNNKIALENIRYLNNRLGSVQNATINQINKEFELIEMGEQNVKIHSKIKVSALVSTYNSEKFIRGCLDDLINQTLFKKDELEIIVINSGSLQGEHAIISEYAEKFPNIIYQRTERETLYATWNRAVHLASGKYLTNANTDDRHKNDSFEILYDILEEKNVGLAYCDVFVTSVENETFSNNSAEKIWILPEFSLRQALAHCPFGSQVMWKRSLHEEVGYFDESFISAGDYEFFLRASIKANAIHVKQVLGLYYESKENLSYANQGNVIREVHSFLDNYRKNLSLTDIYPYLKIHNNTVAQIASKLDYASCISSSSVYPNYELALDILKGLLQLESSFQNLIINNIIMLLYKLNRENEALELIQLLPFEEQETANNIKNAISNSNEMKMFSIPFPALTSMGEVIPIQNKYENLNSKIYESQGEKLQNEILWIAPFFNPSGYASEAIGFALGLDKKISLTIRHQNVFVSEEFIKNLPLQWSRTLYRLHKVDPHKWRENFSYNKNTIIIHHQPGNSLIKFENAKYCIGRTMYETDRLPKDWIEKCNQMDEIWVPSKFNVETFAKYGVDKNKLVVIPEGIDTEVFNPDKVEKYALPNKATFNFLSIFEWTNRKGWDVLLKAYFETFSNKDDVCLYLRTYLLGNYDNDSKLFIQNKINNLIAKEGYSKRKLPRIELLTNQLPFKEMLQLYKSVDAFVLPSRGEGWGRPYMEAMSMGLPVIGTNWSGNTEFMTEENSYLIKVEKLVEIRENEIESYLGHKWAQPSVYHLKRILLEVFEHQEKAKEKGFFAKKDISEKYNLDAIAKIVVERLKQIENNIIPTPGTNSISNVSLKRKNPSLVWEGPQLVNSSLALVNRELCTNLERNGFDLLKINTDNETLKSALKNKYEIPNGRNNKKLDKIEFHIRHQWPPNLTPPDEGHWIIIQPWEYGSLPKQWVNIFSKSVDEMWVPSNYVRKIYVECGIPSDRVFVVPNGFNPETFNPNVKPYKFTTKKNFKFLFVGGTIYRKGIDIVLQSYLQAFTNKDDVTLVIKDMGGNSFYKGQNFKNKILEIQKAKNSPEIIYIDKNLSEKELSGLYTACNILVHPYRGEGFGLPILEAMASGIPAIITNGGAALDFCNSSNSILVHAEKKFYNEKKIGDLETVDFPWILEPDQLDVSEKMKFAFNNKEKVKEIGLNAYNSVKDDWKWDNSFKILKDRLYELSQKPIIRLFKIPTEGINQSLDPKAKILEAENLIRKNDLKNSRSVLNEIIKTDQFNLDALNNLSVIEIIEGHYEKGNELLDLIISKDPTNKIAMNNKKFIETKLTEV